VKVAIVMPLATQRGGAEVALQQLMKEGRGQGIEWTLVFLEDGPMVQEFRDLGVPVSVVPAGRLRHIHRYVQTVNALRSLARRERIELILSWMGKAHLYAGVAAVLAKLPSAWNQPGIPRAGDAFDRLATMLPARGVIVPSRAAGAAQASIRPARKLHLVYPGIDLERFDPGALPPVTEAREALGLPAGTPLIGFFGRLQRSKGAHLLVEALPDVLEVLPEARCLIVGGRHELEPGYLDEIDARIAALGLNQHVGLAGFQANVPLWMQAMEVIVLPSANEAFGITVIEAMAMGKPVIAGASGGPAEIIMHGVNGVLVPHDDASAIARTIVDCLSRPDHAHRLAANARARAADFTAERYARAVIEAVRELRAG
jgi:glycosyltransferase involved in cell wall biosynthesis